MARFQRWPGWPNCGWSPVGRVLAFERRTGLVGCSGYCRWCGPRWPGRCRRPWAVGLRRRRRPGCRWHRAPPPQASMAAPASSERMNSSPVKLLIVRVMRVSPFLRRVSPLQWGVRRLGDHLYLDDEATGFSVASRCWCAWLNGVASTCLGPWRTENWLACGLRSRRSPRWQRSWWWRAA